MANPNPRRSQTEMLLSKGNYHGGKEIINSNQAGSAKIQQFPLRLVLCSSAVGQRPVQTDCN